MIEACARSKAPTRMHSDVGLQMTALKVLFGTIIIVAFVNSTSFDFAGRRAPFQVGLKSVCDQQVVVVGQQVVVVGQNGRL